MTQKRKRQYKRRKYRIGVRERQIQMIQRIIGMVLTLCIVLLGIMVVQQIRGKTTKEVAAPEAEAKVNEGADNVTGENVSASGDEAADGAIAPENLDQVQLTISAAGDCTLGTDEEFDADSSFDTVYRDVGDASYFFRNVKPVFEQDDLTIVNLEGPLTTSDDMQEKEFAFRGKPEYTKILTEGSVEAVNLANNHSYDYGDQGYEDTIQNVEAAGISSFGYDRTAIQTIKGTKVGLVGIYVLADGMEREAQLKEKIAAVKNEGAQLIIVSFHWGAEKEDYPDETQVQLAHIAIDNGADLVLGHHPHVLQGIEKYKGRYIAYSLANFCFGGNSNPSDKDTIIFQQTFTIKDGSVVEDDNIQVIPCSISSEDGYNNYQPTLAEGDEKTRIQERIDNLSANLSSGEDKADEQE